MTPRDPVTGPAVSPVWRRADICSGSPCIRGTRVPVRSIKSFHRAGYTAEQIIRQYPGLTVAMIEAAVRWGTRRHAPS